MQNILSFTLVNILRPENMFRMCVPTLFSNTNIITVIEYSENERSHWFPKSCSSQGAMSVQARVCYRWSPA